MYMLLYVCISLTHTVLHGYQLSPREHVISVTSVSLGSDSTPYYVAGTAFVDPMEKEPNRGRVLLFRVSDTSQSDKHRWWGRGVKP